MLPIESQKTSSLSLFPCIGLFPLIGAGKSGAFGGGLDFRLTRLISLRAEVRDFVSRRGIGLTDGRNHLVFGFGMGFHW